LWGRIENRFGFPAVFLTDGGDEAVTDLRDALDEDRASGGVAKSGAELADGGVETGIKLAIGVVRPEFLLKLLAGNDLTRMGEQKRENARGLVLEFEANSELVELEAPHAEFENSEADCISNHQANLNLTEQVQLR
jgi:hypothetical protein